MGCAGCGGLGVVAPVLKRSGGIETSYPCPADHPYFPKSTPLCNPKYPYKSTINGQTVPGNPQAASVLGGSGSSTTLYIVGGLAVLGIAAYLYLK